MAIKPKPKRFEILKNEYRISSCQDKSEILLANFRKFGRKIIHEKYKTVVEGQNPKENILNEDLYFRASAFRRIYAWRET